MFSRGRSRQRLASANKLRVVLFTSSRKLDTKADKKERARVRARASTSTSEYEHEHGAATLECRGGVGKAADAGRKKRFHAGSKTRTDTFTYFSARHWLFPGPWHSSSVRLIQTTLSEAAEALGNLRI